MAAQQYPSMQMPPRLPLVVVTSNRNESVTKDARLVNCYIEISPEGELDIYKRPGLSSAGTIALNQPGRGLFFWQGDSYAIYGSVLYRNGISVGTGLDTTNGIYRFDSILGAIPKMVFGNGAKAYAYTVAGGVTADLHTIDNDYPIVTVKGFAYLNGPIYVMQSEAVIWGSKVNSVSVAGDWEPLNFIRAQIEPDKGVFLSKQLVYVVALKQWSTEYFFDAGNATGSPLGSVQGMKVHYGCASGESVQKIDDVLCFLSTNQTASLQVAMLNQGAFKVVSTPAIDRLLNNINTTTIYSWQLKMNGHSFYVITFKEGNLTLAYDIIQDLWFQWTDSNGNYFPVIASSYDSSGRHLLQHESNGQLFYINSTTYKDLDQPIVIDIITPNFDADTYRKKQLNIMKFVGDQVEGSKLQVRRTDDDYQHWSQWRNVDLGQKTPMLTNCGTFKKRAYHLRHTQDLPFRIRAIEVQYDVGVL